MQQHRHVIFHLKNKNEDGDKAGTYLSLSLCSANHHGAAALLCKNKNNRDPLQKLDFEQHVKQNWQGKRTLLTGISLVDLSQHEYLGFFCNYNTGGTDRWRFVFSIFIWKEGTERKKLALASSCALVVLGQNRNGVVARDERGEQFGEGNWGLVHQCLICNRNRKICEVEDRNWPWLLGKCRWWERGKTHEGTLWGRLKMGV